MAEISLLIIRNNRIDPTDLSSVIIGKKLSVRLPFRTAAVCFRTQQKHEMFQKWDSSGFDLACHRVLVYYQWLKSILRCRTWIVVSLILAWSFLNFFKFSFFFNFYYDVIKKTTHVSNMFICQQEVLFLPHASWLDSFHNQLLCGFKISINDQYMTTVNYKNGLSNSNNSAESLDFFLSIMSADLLMFKVIIFLNCMFVVPRFQIIIFGMQLRFHILGEQLRKFLLFYFPLFFWWK